MHNLTNLLKIVLPIFFLYLIGMPFGYYEFVRFIAMIGFAYLAFDAIHFERSKESFIFIALAILFQPYFKIALGSKLWNILDVLFGIGLIASISIKPTKARS